MATDSGHPTSPLDELCDAAADGAAGGWDDVETTARDPAERELVRQLRAIGRIARHFLGGGAPPPREPEETQPPRGGEPDGDAEETGPPTPSRTWGQFELREEVGQGAYGTVYRAWDPLLQHEVAVKLLHNVEPSASHARLIHEARLLARVHHSNVVTVLGADRLDGCVGLWMELIKGRTLRHVMDQFGSFSAQEATVIGIDLCRALAAVHNAGLVHRDVKAQNVMREAGGRIVLMDFGAADALDSADGKATLRGTPLYLAPELLEGGAPSHQSDLYSLGVLLYHLVSGAFPRTGRNIGELRAAHARGFRVRLLDARPDLPSAYVRAVDEAIAARPGDRPQTAGALQELLESALGVRGPAPITRPKADRRRSIVVLPFVDLSTGRNLEFFCDGVAEEIANTLSGNAHVRVVASGSAAHFKGSTTDPGRLAAILGVDTVLEGSVRASGERLRVIARVVDAPEGSQRWSERFDCTLDDVFAVQDRIAAAAVRALGIGIASGAHDTALSSTRSAHAYTLYLKGRYCWNQRTEAALRESVRLFEAAVGEDPDYAEAYAALAEAYATLGCYGAVAPDDAMPRARSAASTAIELAERLPSPYATSGCIAAIYEWRWTAAAEQFRRAIELSPAHPAAHHWYAINYLVPLGRLAEAGTELQHAIDADPLSMPIRVSVGMRSYFARQYPDAERELRESLSLDPGSVPGRVFLGLSLVEMGQAAEALRQLETAAHLSRSPETVAALGYARARAGHAEGARELLDELVTTAAQRYVSPSLIAQVHVALGDSVAALDWVEKAVDVRAADLAWIGVRPVFDRLRAEQRFGALMARVGVASPLPGER